MEPGGAELKAAREGLILGVDVTPGVEPGVLGGAPQIAEQQSLLGCRGGGPAERLIDDVGDDVGQRIVSEAAHVDGFGIPEGLRPKEGGLFGIGQGRGLGEASPGVGVDEGVFVEKRGADGGVLHHVVELAELVTIGDVFADGDQGGLRIDEHATDDVEPGHGQAGGHDAGFQHLPGDAGGFAVKRHAVGDFGVAGLSPTVEAEEVGHGAVDGFFVGGP